ncbi:MAG: hypothetical protein ABW184_05910 [Sphingobium sp.]
MSSEATLQEARDRAALARVAVRDAASDLFASFTPSRLKAEAALSARHRLDEAKVALRKSIRTHPLLACLSLAGAATLITYLLRRPVAALARTGARSFGSLRERLTWRK